VARYSGVQIVGTSSGGSGINTYDSISLGVTWQDRTWDPLGEYLAEELPLPNYIPPSNRKSSKNEIVLPVPQKVAGINTQYSEAAMKMLRFPLLGAYDLCLKCSHYFNILDARGAISVTERVGVIARVRALAVGIAKAWMNQQYSVGKTENSDSAAKPGVKGKK
jgi:hypothetical protein